MVMGQSDGGIGGRKAISVRDVMAEDVEERYLPQIWGQQCGHGAYSGMEQFDDGKDMRKTISVVSTADMGVMVM